MNNYPPEVEYVDDQTAALYLELPGSKVVLLQSAFELAECAGVVRTIDIRNSKVCIITTPTMLAEVFEILNGLKAAMPPIIQKRGQIPWRLIPKSEVLDAAVLS